MIRGWSKVPAERIVFVGNDPVTDGQAAAAGGWANFVFARYGAPSTTPTPQWAAIAHTIDSFPETLGVLEKLRF